MATLTATTSDHPLPYRNIRIAYFPEGASQSFKRGHLVILSSGKLVKAASDPSANTVVGVAAEDASGVTDRKIGVYVGTEDAEFVGRVQNTQATAITQVGAQYGVVLDATYDIFRVDIGETSTKVVTVTEILDTVGDVNGHVVFKFLNAARAPYWS